MIDSEAYLLEKITIATLTDALLLQHASGMVPTPSGLGDIQPVMIAINAGEFTSVSRTLPFPTVRVAQSDSLRVYCSCLEPKNKLCAHQILVLWAILSRRELRLFFDDGMRCQAMREIAKDYGIENETELDAYFELSYAPKEAIIRPRRNDLIPMTAAGQAALELQLLPNAERVLSEAVGPANLKKIAVFTKRRHHDSFGLELFLAETSQSGKIKNPLVALPPLDAINEAETVGAVKFYASAAKFQNYHRAKKESVDVEALRWMVANPLGFRFFLHSSQISEKITAHALISVAVKLLKATPALTVTPREPFFEISGTLSIEGVSYGFDQVAILYDYFVQLEDTLYLLDNPDFLRVIQFLSEKGNRLIIHQSKYDQFQQTILAKLENQVPIHYKYLKPATASQLSETNFERERLIYLEDSEPYILITPVMKYGSVEVPVLSRKQIYALDSRGKPFTVKRDEEAEIQFTLAVLNQHPDFQEQPYRDHYYLHKKYFLDEDWFLNTFEAWTEQGIQILGFNKLKNNRFNPNKITVAIHVSSGLNWFETDLGVSYGRQRVSLKHLHKAIRNRSKYVTLNDGTLGLLPTEWLDRFSRYFAAGEVVNDRIRTHRANFAGIQELYTREQLSAETQNLLETFNERLANFQTMEPVAPPEELGATLRSYQQEGLRWLNGLDELGLGGCLADDMGLGKTLQIIAFLLLQRQKRPPACNLIVVPTSLLFNWQSEVARFAPGLKLFTLHGANRRLKKGELEHYDILLTTYGTVLTEVHHLKNYGFNYIILDESQAIKNPESQRYLALQKLQSRNKIVMTGTPLENHTFDLYGQLSFACPGLLSDYQTFKAHYSVPIDKFDDRKRADELQQKISPFVLRRTKEQVARELPDKTEMVIHCEMGTQQRHVYDAYEREFRQFLLITQEGDIPRSRLHVLQGLTKLRQICNAPSLLNNEEYYGSMSAKIDVLMEQIEGKSPNHKILVFSQFVGMLDLIKNELETRQIGFEYLTGQTRNRAARVNRFQTDASVRVFLISLKAGGVGLNLTEADYVYLVDPWWNPAVEDQAIDRSHRIGQTKPVIAVRLICPDTIEERIQELQLTKKSLTQRLVKADSVLLNSLTKTDLLALLSRP